MSRYHLPSFSLHFFNIFIFLWLVFVSTHFVYGGSFPLGEYVASVNSSSTNTEQYETRSGFYSPDISYFSLSLSLSFLQNAASFPFCFIHFSRLARETHNHAQHTMHTFPRTFIFLARFVTPVIVNIPTTFIIIVVCSPREALLSRRLSRSGALKSL